MCNTSDGWVAWISCLLKASDDKPPLKCLVLIKIAKQLIQKMSVDHTFKNQLKLVLI